MSDQSYDMNSLFHPNVEIAAEKGAKNTTEYNPSSDKGQNGIYKSVIRFVAWWQDPNHSYNNKWGCWLVDPVTNRGRMVDCPSSVGKPSPLQDIFFKLRKSDSVNDQKKAEIFSRKQVYTAIIQVIKDDQNKEQEGKLLIWKFGKKIFEKYEAEKKPVLGEPHEAFDLFDGKAFALVITKVLDFNNYDQSKFIDKKIPLLIPNSEGKLIPINEKTSREEVFAFLKANSPDLTKYAYKEWDQETHDYVNQVIIAVTGQAGPSTYADVRSNVNTNTPNAPQGTAKSESASMSGITTTELSIDDLNLNLGSSSPVSLELPDINTESDFGLSGDLNDALSSL